jgi:hypothetical protein
MVTCTSVELPCNVRSRISQSVSIDHIIPGISSFKVIADALGILHVAPVVSLLCCLLFRNAVVLYAISTNGLVASCVLLRYE